MYLVEFINSSETYPISIEQTVFTQAEFVLEWHMDLGPLLLIWINFITSMDK